MKIRENSVNLNTHTHAAIRPLTARTRLSGEADEVCLGCFVFLANH